MAAPADGMLQQPARTTRTSSWQGALVDSPPTNHTGNAQPLPPVLKVQPVAPVQVLPAEPTPARFPVHPLSAALLAAVDGLWGMADWVVVDWIVTIPLSFVSVAVPTFCVQKFIRKDSTGHAVAVALLLGVLAAIPTPIIGTPVGLAILGAAGVRRFWGQGRHLK
jgi:hypothetical protein